MTKREPEPSLPMPFELPKNYHHTVMSGLQKGALSGKAKSKFIASVAAAIFRFKTLPTKAEYEHVGKHKSLLNVLFSNHQQEQDM